MKGYLESEAIEFLGGSDTRFLDHTYLSHVWIAFFASHVMCIVEIISFCHTWSDYDERNCIYLSSASFHFLTSVYLRSVCA